MTKKKRTNTDTPAARPRLEANRTDSPSEYIDLSDGVFERNFPDIARRIEEREREREREATAAELSAEPNAEPNAEPSGSGQESDDS